MKKEELQNEEAKEEETVKAEEASEEKESTGGEKSEETESGEEPEMLKKKKKKDKMEEKIEELEDRVKRQMAEFDNFRKRTEKEKSHMYEVGARDVIEKILPVVDNFERGLASVPEDQMCIRDRDSMLQKLCSCGVKKADWWKILLLGFLFSNIFMAKQNFYVFAIYAFCMLVMDWCTAPKEEKQRRFASYLWIAGFALVFLGIRYIPEFAHYGVHRQQVLREMQEKIAIPELNPASAPSIQSSAFNLYGKGVTLREILTEMGFHKTLFRSFIGTYGSLQFPSPDWYGKLMGILYLIYLAWVSGTVLLERGYCERKVKLGILYLCGGVSYALVIYNAWFVDFQAQGRYMLPALIFAAHGAALRPETAKSRWFQVILAATAVLSLYSFATCCIPNITPPY